MIFQSLNHAMFKYKSLLNPILSIKPRSHSKISISKPHTPYSLVFIYGVQNFYIKSISYYSPKSRIKCLLYLKLQISVKLPKKRWCKIKKSLNNVENNTDSIGRVHRCKTYIGRGLTSFCVLIQ
jgi:hypothetical protein